MLLMTQLNKIIRKHWFEWEPEYLQLMDDYRTPIKINRFDESVSKLLLNQSLYAYLEMSICLGLFISSKDKVKKLFV